MTRYRWGIIVNLRDVHFLARDSYEIYRLVKVLLDLTKPAKEKDKGLIRV
jgi:hypothetical protein